MKGKNIEISNQPQSSKRENSRSIGDINKIFLSNLELGFLRYFLWATGISNI